MTIQQELKIYKKALFHYRLSLYIPLIKWFIGTHAGFCYYFRDLTYQDSDGKYHWSIYNLTQLLYQKPSLGERINDMNEDMYWFPPGYLKPRINCLKQAIHNCELIIQIKTEKVFDEN